MASTIKPKQSSTPGNVPTTADLADREIGINIPDKRIYVRADTAIVDLFDGLLPVDGEAATAAKLAEEVALTIGDTTKGFDGSAPLSWSLAEIGAAPADVLQHNTTATYTDTYGINNVISIARESDYNDGGIRNIPGGFAARAVFSASEAYSTEYSGTGLYSYKYNPSQAGLYYTATGITNSSNQFSFIISSIEKATKAFHGNTYLTFNPVGMRDPSVGGFEQKVLNVPYTDGTLAITDDITWANLPDVPASVASLAAGEGAIPRIGYGVSLLENDDLVIKDGATYAKASTYVEATDYPDAPTSVPTVFMSAKVTSGVNITSAVLAIETASGTLFTQVNGTADAYLVDNTGMATYVATLGGGSAYTTYARLGSILVLFSTTANTTYYYSTNDGVTWSSTATPTSGAGLRVMSNGTRIVAVQTSSASTAYYSVDGINWTSTAMPSAANWSACDAGGGMFVAASSAAGTAAAYSMDGITWTASTKPSGTVGNALFMFGKFYFFVNGSSATVYTTVNGITWSTETLSTAINFSRGVYSSTISAAFVTQGASANCWESFDGTNWTACTGKAATTNIPFAHGVVYSGTNMKRLPLYAVVGFPNPVDYLYMRVA